MQADAKSEEYQKRRPHRCGQLNWAKATGRGQRKTLQTMLEEGMMNQLRSAERLRTWSRMRKSAWSVTRLHPVTYLLDSYKNTLRAPIWLWLRPGVKWARFKITRLRAAVLHAIKFLQWEKDC